MFSWSFGRGLTVIHLKTQSVSCSAMASFRLLPMWFWQELSFLEDIKEKYDVCYQMNCGFALERRLSASLLARRLIQNQIVDIWATDAHNLTTRPPKMAEAFQFFTERKNIKALKMFVTEDQLD